MTPDSLSKPIAGVEGDGGEDKGASSKTTELTGKAQAPTDLVPSGGHLSRVPAEYILVLRNATPEMLGAINQFYTDLYAAPRRRTNPWDDHRAMWRTVLAVVSPPPAQGMEAGTVETEGLGLKDDSPTRRDAPQSLPPTGGVPEEIEKAIEEFEDAVRQCDIVLTIPKMMHVNATHSALTSTILRHLSTAIARAERAEKLHRLFADAQPMISRHGDEIVLYCPDGTITDDLYEALEAAVAPLSEQDRL